MFPSSYTYFYIGSFLHLHSMSNKTPAKHRDFFRDTLIGKNVWRKRGSNARPTGWETKKFKHKPVRTLALQPDWATIIEQHKLSGDRVAFWQKNASQIMIFLPHLCGRKITIVFFWTLFVGYVKHSRFQQTQQVDVFILGQFHWHQTTLHFKMTSDFKCQWL